MTLAVRKPQLVSDFALATDNGRPSLSANGPLSHRMGLPVTGATRITSQVIPLSSGMRRVPRGAFYSDCTRRRRAPPPEW
jgi:hypothetical protein